MGTLASAFFLSAAVHAGVLLFPGAMPLEPPEEEAFPVVLLIEERTSKPERPAEKREDPLPPGEIPPPVGKPEPIQAGPEETPPALPEPAMARSAPESWIERSVPEEKLPPESEAPASKAPVSEPEETPGPVLAERFPLSEPERERPEPAPVRGGVAAKSAREDVTPAGPPSVKVRYAFTPVPDYPKRAREKGWEGRVLLRVLVNPEGSAEKVEVSDSSGFSMLDSAAVKSVRQWKFHPARAGDERVPMWIKVPVDFQLAATGK